MANGRGRWGLLLALAASLAAGSARAQGAGAGFEGLPVHGSVADILAELRGGARSIAMPASRALVPQPSSFEVFRDSFTGMRWSIAPYLMIWEAAEPFCLARGARSPSLGELATMLYENLIPRPRSYASFNWSSQPSEDGKAFMVSNTTGNAFRENKLSRHGVACLHPPESGSSR